MSGANRYLAGLARVNWRRYVLHIHTYSYLTTSALSANDVGHFIELAELISIPLRHQHIQTSI